MGLPSYFMLDWYTLDLRIRYLSLIIYRGADT